MKKLLLPCILICLFLTGCDDMEEEFYEPGIIEDTEEPDFESDFEETEEASVQEDEEAESFTFTGHTLDGDEIDSGIFANSRLTMINVWGTYCGYCINEMPELSELAGEYLKDDFQIYGMIADVSENSDGAVLQNARDLVQMTNADYPHILLNDQLYDDLVQYSDALPTTYFFNSKGEQIDSLVGALSKDDWRFVIDELLSETE